MTDCCKSCSACQRHIQQLLWSSGIWLRSTMAKGRGQMMRKGRGRGDGQRRRDLLMLQWRERVVHMEQVNFVCKLDTPFLAYFWGPDRSCCSITQEWLVLPRQTIAFFASTFVHLSDEPKFDSIYVTILNLCFKVFAPLFWCRCL